MLETAHDALVPLFFPDARGGGGVTASTSSSAIATHAFTPALLSSLFRLYPASKDVLSPIIDALGQASAQAQQLQQPITIAKRFMSSQDRLYFLTERIARTNVGAGDDNSTASSSPSSPRFTFTICGVLRTGEKQLFLHDDNGAIHECMPTCVLDFFVQPLSQRRGFGRILFEAMLKYESNSGNTTAIATTTTTTTAEPCQAHNLAYDRPSNKLIAFLTKHYRLGKYATQSNHYIVFSAFFRCPLPTAGLPTHRSKKASGTDAGAATASASASRSGTHGAPTPTPPSQPNRGPARPTTSGAGMRPTTASAVGSTGVPYPTKAVYAYEKARIRDEQKRRFAIMERARLAAQVEDEMAEAAAASAAASAAPAAPSDALMSPSSSGAGNPTSSSSWSSSPASPRAAGMGVRFAPETKESSSARNDSFPSSNSLRPIFLCDPIPPPAREQRASPGVALWLPSSSDIAAKQGAAASSSSSSSSAAAATTTAMSPTYASSGAEETTYGRRAGSINQASRRFGSLSQQQQQQQQHAPISPRQAAYQHQKLNPITGMPLDWDPSANNGIGGTNAQSPYSNSFGRAEEKTSRSRSPVFYQDRASTVSTTTVCSVSSTPRGSRARSSVNESLSHVDDVGNALANELQRMNSISQTFKSPMANDGSSNAPRSTLGSRSSAFPPSASPPPLASRTSVTSTASTASPTSLAANRSRVQSSHEHLIGVGMPRTFTTSSSAAYGNVGKPYA